MTHYEILRTELRGLVLWRTLAVMVPAVAMALFFGSFAESSMARFVGGCACVIVLPFILHRVWRLTFPTYREWHNRLSNIWIEIGGLQKRIAAIFDTYRERQKGEQFKQAFDLVGRSVREFEEAISVGMFRERREIFVTAFMRDGVAARVTASIGSPFRCSAADNPARWKNHVERHGCDEIRQYHNHPVHNGSTRPSATDVKSSATLKLFLGPHGSKLRSLIICWNVYFRQACMNGRGWMM